MIWLVPETREVPGPVWAKQTLQHQSEGCHDQGRLHRSSIRDNLDFWWWSDCNGLSGPSWCLRIPPPAPRAPAVLPSGARSCWVQEEHTPKVNWISSPALLRQQCGSWPCPWQGGDSDQAEGKPCLTPGSTRSLYLWVCFCFVLHICFVFFRWKWHLRCHVRCLSMTYSLFIIISGFYSHCCKWQFHFLFLSNIPLYIYTLYLLYLFTCQWALFSSHIDCIYYAAINIWVHICFELMFSFSLGKSPAVGLLNCMVVLFLILWRNSILFTMVPALIYIPTNTVPGFPFLQILTNTCYFSSFWWQSLWQLWGDTPLWFCFVFPCDVKYLFICLLVISMFSLGKN